MFTLAVVRYSLSVVPIKSVKLSTFTVNTKTNFASPRANRT